MRASQTITPSGAASNSTRSKLGSVFIAAKKLD
jgi:hypothetical protein